MYYLGIDLGGTNIAAGVVNEQYQIVGRSKTKTHVPCSEEEMCSQLAFAAQTLEGGGQFIGKSFKCHKHSPFS